ncbi:MAG: hypothetical protein JST32_05295 [Bacteroidetes bacterium]|nr:hypothetical protein [Bacteroidota bacterium]
MNKKQHPFVLNEIFGPNTGTWMLIIIHLFILFVLVFVFHDIIVRLQEF